MHTPATKPQAPARKLLPLRKYPYLIEGRRFIEYPPFHWLNPYLLLVIAANFFCIFMKSYGGDMEYWRSWVSHLATHGYEKFDGNYPPLYVHWLYLVGKVMLVLNQPFEVNNLLKFLTQLPVVLCHLVLTRLVFSILMHRNISGAMMHTIMLVTVLNPALLMNGPVWGQVDIVPVTFIVCAFYLLLLNRFLWLALPLFTLALLTKFQMICFAPVFGIIFFRRAKDSIMGCLLSAALIVVVLLPLAMTDTVEHIIVQAYIETLGQYPYTTYNAANIWMLFTGNTWPDSYVLFNLAPDSWGGQVLRAKHVGILLFAIVCLWVFMRGMSTQLRHPTKEYSLTEASQHVFYALLCATAFFVFLPGMHERYLIPATTMALVYAAIYPQKLVYAVALTLASFLNIAMIHGINGSDLWDAISLISVFAMLYLLADFTGLSARLARLSKPAQQILSRGYVPALSFVVATAAILFVLHNTYSLHQPALNERQLLLTELKVQSSKQDYGKLKIDRNIHDKVLSLRGKKYGSGLGTHANSTIVYELPQGVETLNVTVGIDDAANNGEVVFSISGDGKRLWRSEVIYGNRKMAETAEVSIDGVEQLTLHVDARGSTAYDHANWVNPILTFKAPGYLAPVTRQ